MTKTIAIKEELFLDIIDGLGFCLHDVDLSLNNADSELVELLEELERECHKTADEIKLDWKGVLAKRGSFADDSFDYYAAVEEAAGRP